MLRRVREQLFICYRDGSAAPGSRGLPPHTPASCEIRANFMTYPLQPRPPAVRAHFAFRNLCIAGCGNRCSSVIVMAFPHPDPGACCPHTLASSEIRADIMTHSVQPRPSAVRAYFAFRNLCIAGCGNRCSSVIMMAFPHPDPGACCPHTLAS